MKNIKKQMIIYFLLFSILIVGSNGKNDVFNENLPFYSKLEYNSNEVTTLLLDSNETTKKNSIFNEYENDSTKTNNQESTKTSLISSFSESSNDYSITNSNDISTFSQETNFLLTTKKESTSKPSQARLYECSLDNYSSNKYPCGSKYIGSSVQTATKPSFRFVKQELIESGYFFTDYTSICMLSIVLSIFAILEI
jgi:hypothetical protein